jgi:Photosynthetic reaction centre cytochrome C subunit
MKKPFIAGLLLIAGCATATAPAAAPQPAPNPEFRNLQVLPRDITREQLLATMRTFTRGLGVRCNHCHVVTATAPKEVLDFPADTKEEKRVARVMLRMVNDINGTWMHRVEEAEGEHVDASAPPEMRVVCWTCHRGKTEPEAPPPPEPRPAS